MLLCPHLSKWELTENSNMTQPDRNTRSWNPLAHRLPPAPSAPTGPANLISRQHSIFPIQEQPHYQRGFPNPGIRALPRNSQSPAHPTGPPSPVRPTPLIAVSIPPSRKNALPCTIQGPHACPCFREDHDLRIGDELQFPLYCTSTFFKMLVTTNQAECITYEDHP